MLPYYASSSPGSKAWCLGQIALLRIQDIATWEQMTGQDSVIRQQLLDLNPGTVDHPLVIIGKSGNYVTFAQATSFRNTPIQEKCTYAYLLVFWLCLRDILHVAATASTFTPP